MDDGDNAKVESIEKRVEALETEVSNLKDIIMSLIMRDIISTNISMDLMIEDFASAKSHLDELRTSGREIVKRLPGRRGG